MDNKQNLSCQGIVMHSWSALKTGLTKCMGNQGNPSAHEKRYLTAVSWIQLFLGFLCICLALVGLAAAFDTKASIAFQNNDEVTRQLHSHYHEYIRNITKEAYQQRIDLTTSFKEEIKAMKDNCGTPTITTDYPISDVRSYNNRHDVRYDHRYVDRYADRYADRYGYNDYRYPTPPSEYELAAEFRRWYCGSEYCTYTHYSLKGHHLIIEYLAVPSWVGIMLIITGLVGFRTVRSWDKVDYLQISHGYTLLNAVLIFLFAPGMMAVGIAQMFLASDWIIPGPFTTISGEGKIFKTCLNFGGHCSYLLGVQSKFPFRHYVGLTTVVFAVIIISFTSCCCPVGPYMRKYFQQFEDEKEKTKQEKNDVPIIA